MITCYATACAYNNQEGDYPQCEKDDGITITDDLICEDYEEPKP